MNPYAPAAAMQQAHAATDGSPEQMLAWLASRVTVDVDYAVRQLRRAQDSKPEVAKVYVDAGLAALTPSSSATDSTGDTGGEVR